MSAIYIVAIVLTTTSGAQQELHREVIKASTPAICQAHADKLAAEHRAREADTLRRFGGRVSGSCMAVSK